jgi:hypothetical protein
VRASGIDLATLDKQLRAVQVDHRNVAEYFRRVETKGLVLACPRLRQGPGVEQ